MTKHIPKSLIKRLEIMKNNDAWNFRKGGSKHVVSLKLVPNEAFFFGLAISKAKSQSVNEMTEEHGE